MISRRGFMKLLAALGLALYVPPIESEKMPIQNYSQDYVLALLKQLYQQSNTPLPQAEFDTLERLVNEERAEAEKQRAWIRVQDGRIGVENLDLPFALIHSEIVLTDTASLTIPIPSGYNHLLILGSGKSDAGGTVFMNFNGDTGATNYSFNDIEANGVGASIITVGDLTYPAIPIGSFLTTAGGTAPGSFVCFIPHYAESTYQKTAVSQSIIPTRALYFTGNWISAASIESITFTITGGNNILAGSILTLYGMK